MTDQEIHEAQAIVADLEARLREGTRHGMTLGHTGHQVALLLPYLRHLEALPAALPTVPAAAPVAQSGWVSCADALPEKGEIVLIHRKVRGMNQEIGYAMHVAERWPDEYTYNTWRTEGGEAYGDFMVTHWQPLPTPPTPC